METERREARLIDADALIKIMTETLEALLKNPKMDNQEAHLLAAFHTVGKMIEDAPTVEPIKVVDVCKECWRDGGNAVEVVRCKDCRWFDYSDLSGTIEPISYRCKRFGRTYRYPCDFCSYGERRSE